jgi:integrase
MKPAPAHRLIERFIRDHARPEKWSEVNVANFTSAMNRLHAWLTEHDSHLLDDTYDDADRTFVLVEQLTNYIDHRRRTPSEVTGKLRADSTIQSEHRQLAAFYKWAANELGNGDDIIARNPMLKVKLGQPAPPDRSKLPVTQQWQVDALLATTRRRKRRSIADRRDAAIITLLWHTGMRRSEVSSIDYERVDFGAESVYLPRTKGGRRGPKSRHVPLSTDAMRALDLWIDVRGTADGPLFTGQRGARLSACGIATMLDRRGEAAGKALGLDGPVRTLAHGYRRASAIAWLEAGGSETLLANNHGWSPNSPMIAVYTEPNKDRLTALEARRVAEYRRTINKAG